MACRSGLCILALAYGASGQSSVGDSCPEPIRQLLKDGMLAMLTVEKASCEQDGNQGAHFAGETRGHGVSGFWRNYCVGDMHTVHIEMHKKGCMDYHDCTTHYNASITPDEFLAACPPDRRDSDCKSYREAWDTTNCNDLLEGHGGMPSDGSTSDALEASAESCFGLLHGYTECLQQFNNTEEMNYFHATMPPPELSSRLEAMKTGMHRTGCGDGDIEGEPEHCVCLAESRWDARGGTAGSGPPGVASKCAARNVAACTEPLAGVALPSKVQCSSGILHAARCL
mmetsp:Transcript_93452/g.269940  ORF Transcript_93452/g.269940 Transcript_93452/m.269940 type:complete len:284 (-) Transcript_93452:90-941(-)